MKNMANRALAAVALLLTLGASLSFGAPKPEMLRVKTGILSGVVTDATGKALADVALQIKQEGKVVSESKSDAKGKYALTGLPAGKLELLVNGHAPLRLMAAADSDVTELQLIVPQREPYSAGQFPELAASTWIWVGVGAGAAAAVATPVIVNNTQGGSGSSSPGNVSP